MKKNLLNHARQLHQRRMSIFHFLEQPMAREHSALLRQSRLPLPASPAHSSDRPRTAREMFAEIEYDDSEYA